MSKEPKHEPLREPWGSFEHIIESDPAQSCWPVAHGAKECRNGHVLSTRYTSTIYRDVVDPSTGEILTNAEGRRLREAVVVPQHMAAPRSFLDPTALVRTLCECGHRVHPVSGEDAGPGWSWIRCAATSAMSTQGHTHLFPLPDWAMEPRT